ncbi:MAG: hypothetical protein L3J95_02575 [Thermoplasmata archaeon]|nr:hypothetical protein [Thermoplasmata archaeon]MCI4359292.1 hypothetical protein [Thermoplasmata archaeon]
MQQGAADPPRPQAILTEILGILVEELWVRAAGQLADRTGANPRNVLAAFGSRISAFERGGEDLEAFYREVCLEAELTMGVEEFARVVLDSALESVPTNYEFLRKLRERDPVRVLAVANIPGPVFEAIDRKYPLSELFDDTILSFREGIAKPNAQVYIQAIERAAVEPSSILYLDASEEYVAGAREWGLRSVRLKGPSEFVPSLSKWFGPAA